MEIPLIDGDVSRVTEPPSSFPSDVDVGSSVIINTGLTESETIQGCFNALFNSDDGTKRTLEGSFETTLEVGL